MVINEGTDEAHHVIWPSVHRKPLNSNYPQIPKRKVTFFSLSLVVVNLIMSLKCKHSKKKHKTPTETEERGGHSNTDGCRSFLAKI